MLYVAPVVTLLGVCDRQPEREAECLERLRSMWGSFFAWFMAKRRKVGETMEQPGERWVLCPMCGAKTRLRLLAGKALLLRKRP